MRSESSRRGVVFLALLGALAAQNVTVPASLQGVEGGGGTNVPFGGSLPTRIQYVYDAEELPWSGPRVLTGLLLRADNNVLNTAMPAKGYLDISVLMSTTGVTSGTASGVFEDNWGADATWVIDHVPIQLPAQPALATAPRPANIPFVFSAPWVYGLTPATQGMPPPSNLLIEIVIHSMPSGTYKVDNLTSCIAPTTTFGPPGAACAEQGGVPIELTGDASMQAGFAYNWHLQHAGASMPFLLFLDMTNTGGLLGNPAWPLPYPMFDPQNPSVPSPPFAAFGYSAPDCYVSVNPVAMLSGVCDSSGNGTTGGMLAPGRQYVGLTMYAQAFALTLTANPMHFISSNGFGSTVCGPLGVARIYTTFSTSQTTLPASGVLQRGVGLIFDVM